MLEALERVEQTFKEKEINRDTEESSTLYPAYLKDENFLAEMKSHYGIFQKLFLSSFKLKFDTITLHVDNQMLLI